MPRMRPVTPSTDARSDRGSFLSLVMSPEAFWSGVNMANGKQLVGWCVVVLLGG